jgi:hypothetical protein
VRCEEHVAKAGRFGRGGASKGDRVGPGGLGGCFGGEGEVFEGGGVGVGGLVAVLWGSCDEDVFLG